MAIGRIGRGLAVFIGIILLAGCFARPDKEREVDAFEKTFFAMDTFVSVRIYTDSNTRANTVFQEVEAEICRLEGILSAHLPGSDLARIEGAAGLGPVAVSSDTLAVINTALKYAELTEDAFDITLAPVLRLYNFTRGNETKPTRQELAANLPLIDWRKVQVDMEAGTVFLLEKKMGLDLGGIAKGYMTDRVAEILSKQNLEASLINAGGDIRLLGPKLDGSPWRVGIKNPDSPDSNFAIVESKGGAIVTSGDYERYFDVDGVRYHHIISPKTGLPANLVRSVTIIAPTGEVADLLSTAVFVMGAEAGLKLVEELAGVEAVIWDREGAVFNSSGLELVPTDTPSAQYLFKYN